MYDSEPDESDKPECSYSESGHPGQSKQDDWGRGGALTDINTETFVLHLEEYNVFI